MDSVYFTYLVVTQTSVVFELVRILVTGCRRSLLRDPTACADPLRDPLSLISKHRNAAPWVLLRRSVV